MGTRGASLVDLEIKKDNREKAILRAPTMDMLLKGLHAIELYTHLTLRKVRNDEAKGTSWDVRVGEYCDMDIVINSVEGLAEIKK